MSKKKNKAPIRLTRRQWAECEVLWARGDDTLADLSKKFGGVRPETISLHMKKEGITKGETAGLLKDELEAELLKREKRFAKSRAERIIQTREEMYAIVRSLTIGVARVAHQAKNKGEPLGIHLATIKAHKEAIAAVKLGREEVYNILNYDPTQVSDDDLPELVVREMTEEEEKEIRRSQEADDNLLNELREAEQAGEGESSDANE